MDWVLELRCASSSLCQGSRRSNRRPSRRARTRQSDLRWVRLEPALLRQGFRNYDEALLIYAHVASAIRFIEALERRISATRPRISAL